MEAGLSDRCTLAGSPIWNLQADFYASQGIKAWSAGTVPFHITNTPILARTYNALILGYLRDLQAQNLLCKNTPLFILEIGGGTGRHAYMFLRAWESLCQKIPLAKDIKIQYILTDLCHQNISYYKTHPRFQQFIEQGLLDFAVFEAEQGTSVISETTGDYILPKSSAHSNPLIVIANYVFDSLTTELFKISHGACQPILVSTHFDSQGLRKSKSSPSFSLNFNPGTIGSNVYYQDPLWREILDDYTATLSDTVLSFPVGAFKAWLGLSNLASGRFLLLAADKGFVNLKELEGLDYPEPDFHGSFSFDVNFHALGELCQKNGGLYLKPSTSHGDLQICAFLLDPMLTRTPELQYAYRINVEDESPSDRFTLIEAIASLLDDTHDSVSTSLDIKAHHNTPADDSITSRRLLALHLLKLSGWDPNIFFSLSDIIARELEEATPEIKASVTYACQRVWDYYYHIGESSDLPFEIGRVYYRLDLLDESLKFYSISLQLHGDHPSTYFNIGLCRFYQGEYQKAEKAFAKAIELQPDYDDAHQWLARTKGLTLTLQSNGSQND